MEFSERSLPLVLAPLPSRRVHPSPSEETGGPAFRSLDVSGLPARLLPRAAGCAILSRGRGAIVQSNDSKPDAREVLLVLFLATVVVVALLTVLGSQIETLVFRLTGR